MSHGENVSMQRSSRGAAVRIRLTRALRQANIGSDKARSVAVTAVSFKTAVSTLQARLWVHLLRLSAL